MKSRRPATDAATWRARARRSRRRLLLTALPIVQCSVAAGIAWWVALNVLNHPRPFFAPIAAVVSLGVSMGGRLRRTVELVGGVTVGIGVGDVLIYYIGSGPWQIALVVALAMAAAVTLDGGPIITMQAASSACLVATLLPPGGTAGFDRMIDALTGGLVGVVVVAIAPTNPVRRVRRVAAEILGVLAESLRLTADGLTEQQAAPIRTALSRVRSTQGQIDGLRTNLEGGREISRIAPLYWNARERMEKLAATADPLDNAVRNVRVLIRRALTVVNDDEILDPRLVDEVEKLARAVDVLHAMMLSDPDKKPDAADAARALRSVAIAARPELVADAGLSAHVVFGQLRSTLVDLLQVTGLSRISALALLPPSAPDQYVDTGA